MADKKHEAETFGAEPLIADGRIFVNCRFNGTKLVLTGDGEVSFVGCAMNDVRFEFQGSAARTLRMLQTFYANPASRPMVEGIFNQIRSSGAPPAPSGGEWQA